MTAISKPKVAVIREEGSNGDREMSAALYAAGFEPWDVAMSDLLNGVITLDEFRGIVFVGGFSYADTLSARSLQWVPTYGSIGWVPGPQVGGVFGAGGDPSQPRFIHNESGRFECRFTSVTIEETPAIMFKVKYCDDDGRPTDVYPFNPNGSPLGVAAICSPDGRYP
ncbi:hypothetical protein HAX54_045252 [Datura stramonium]|uniref:Phosphoribosylformylglycinamidine synthase n=1 Tax=Datura stramonium TaxID=4076 RepID=A0ABS8RJI5_DATST|nr:hypothetical protein [Datura stramonium]